MPVENNHSVNFSVTFPKKLLEELDKKRGKMPRATYLQIITEKSLKKK